MSRRVLVLSFYYPPDLSAGSFRVHALVNAIKKKLTLSDSIHVVTTMPNRYASFNVDAVDSEKQENLTISRIKLPNHQSGIVDQAVAFLYFAWRVNKLIKKGGDYELVVATSSRLMTGVLGSRIARKMNAKYYLDIRDIFCETMNELYPTFLLKPVLNLFSRLECFAINKADKLSLVSEGFLPYFRERYPSQSFAVFTNGIDDEFLTQNNSIKKCDNKFSKLNVVYAGNIGDGQGLHKIIPDLAERLTDKINFKIIGDGGRKKNLELIIENRRIKNVEIHEPVTRQRLIQYYLEADVLFLHLNKCKAFLSVLPSKIFEYAALGKPLWLGVDGHSAEFSKREISNVAIFTPCDVEQAVRVLETLGLSVVERKSFIKKYRRVNIMEKMAEDILDLLNK